jgi:hypothetical protein
MADDDATPSNPLVTPEELEETSLDLNVSQRSREEEPPRKVVRTRVDRSVWDRRLSPNPHALTIYLKFVPAREAAPERFEECQCEDDDVRLHCQTWVLGCRNPTLTKCRGESQHSQSWGLGVLRDS